MKRKNISSPSPYENTIGFSRAVRVNNMIFVSGTAPIAPDGSAAYPHDMYMQTKHCLQIIEKAIIEAGGQLSDVVRTRMFLTDVSLWEEAGRAHGEFFSDIKPAATMVGVNTLLNPAWLIEIEAEAYIF